MEPKGIKNILEVLDLILAGVDVGVSVAKDGKVGADDLYHLMKLVPVVGPAIEEVKEVAPEFLDLDGEEGKQIVAHVASKLAVEDAKAKAIVLASMDVLLSGHKLFLAIKG
jgi:hypothetical protein